jgi:hypothetical protein
MSAWQRPVHFLVAREKERERGGDEEGRKREGNQVLISLSRAHPQWHDFLPLGTTS